MDKNFSSGIFILFFSIEYTYFSDTQAPQFLLLSDLCKAPQRTPLPHLLSHYLTLSTRDNEEIIMLIKAIGNQYSKFHIPENGSHDFFVEATPLFLLSGGQ